MPEKEGALLRFSKYSDVLLALGLVAILVVMIIPIPPILMDLMLTLDISLALTILVVVLYTTEPLQLSVFPGLLLLVTLFRLSLNVASTRLILS
ncbi:MAG: FHIPEP family type III secretion protein, partial [Candidatus Glassbacteria bacterium]|nr:FHIPEP family type III secretion protein [Candidatus Glassbacteria bacterium]